MVLASKPVQVKLCKNPYHLYLEAMIQEHDQGELATKINMNEGAFSKSLQYDYLDLGPGEERQKLYPGIVSINKVLRDRFDSHDLDITTAAGRKTIEGKLQEYRYPDDGDSGGYVFEMLRGVWQVLSPSSRRKDLASREPVIRLSSLVFYGFIPRRARSKRYIDLLWIGESTLWKARAIIEQGHDILYLYAKECSTNEHKFFSFHAPGLHDPKRCGQISQLPGVMAGTVVDPDYAQYPVSAVMCIARKLEGWSAWFKENDNFIDKQFIADMRAQMELKYFALGELVKRSHDRPTEADLLSDDNRMAESFRGIANAIAQIHGNPATTSQIIFPSIK